MARERALNRVFLADDPLVQFVFHADELGRLFLGELVDRDAGPVREHLGDDVLVDDVEQVDALGTPFALQRALAVELGLLLVGQLLREFEVLPLEGGFLLRADPRDVLFDLLVLRRRRHPTNAQAAACLVDEVDRLVWEVPVRDVAVGEVRRGERGAWSVMVTWWCCS